MDAMNSELIRVALSRTSQFFMLLHLVLLILFARRKTILNLIRTLRQKDQTAGEAAAAD